MDFHKIIQSRLKTVNNEAEIIGIIRKRSSSKLSGYLRNAALKISPQELKSGNHVGHSTDSIPTMQVLHLHLLFK